MKRLSKLVIYGLVALAIALTINFYPLTATSTNQQTETTTPYSPSRHTITLTLNDLDELKIEEGQRINVGDIISDKPTAWLRYALPKEPNYMRSGIL